MAEIITPATSPIAAADALHHRNPLLAGFTLALLSMLLFGLLYPALATLLGSALFPSQARGSMIEHQGRLVGSTLIAQPFASAGYFRPRPSAAGYDPLAAGGSNWAPSNPSLRTRAVADSQAIARRENVAPSQIPLDLISASGSGLDPHISPASARIQIARIAQARNLAPSVVDQLIATHTEGPTLGIWGQARVNVLRLNLALDQLTHQVAPTR